MIAFSVFSIEVHRIGEKRKWSALDGKEAKWAHNTHFF